MSTVRASSPFYNLFAYGYLVIDLGFDSLGSYSQPVRSGDIIHVGIDLVQAVVPTSWFDSAGLYFPAQAKFGNNMGVDFYCHISI